MIAKHGTVKGPYGPELELAMKNHMDNFSISKNNSGKKTLGKTTIDKLKLLCAGFKETPAFPLIRPITLNTLIKNHCEIQDIRVINKYKKMVLTHSKEKQLPDETFPQLDIEGFCMFVDKLTQEEFLKEN